jgi:hypothetical protein
MRDDDGSAILPDIQSFRQIRVQNPVLVEEALPGKALAFEDLLHQPFIPLVVELLLGQVEGDALRQAEVARVRCAQVLDPFFERNRNELCDDHRQGVLSIVVHVIGARGGWAGLKMHRFRQNELLLALFAFSFARMIPNHLPQPARVKVSIACVHRRRIVGIRHLILVLLNHIVGGVQSHRICAVPDGTPVRIESCRFVVVHIPRIRRHARG